VGTGHLHGRNKDGQNVDGRNRTLWGGGYAKMDRCTQCEGTAFTDVLATKLIQISLDCTGDGAAQGAAGRVDTRPNNSPPDL